MKINIVPEITWFGKDFLTTLWLMNMLDFTMSVHLSLLKSHYFLSRKCMSLQSKDRGQDLANRASP